LVILQLDALISKWLRHIAAQLSDPAPPRLQQRVCGPEFVTRHPVSIKIFIIPLVPALSSEDLF